MIMTGNATAAQEQSASSPSFSLAGPQGLRLQIDDDPARAAAAWQALQGQGAATIYQARDFVQSWMETRGRARGEALLIVSLWRDGEPLMLLPLRLYERHGVRLASFPGGSDSNINMPLMRAGWQPRDAGSLRRWLLDAIARHAGIDVYHLNSMPRQLDGQSNPLAGDEAVPAASNLHEGALMEDFDALMRERRGRKARTKYNWKMNRLKEIGELVFTWAREPAEQERLLDVFIRQKLERFNRLGIPTQFDKPDFRAFMLRLASAGGDDATHRPLELFCLKVGDRCAPSTAAASTTAG